MTTNSSGKIDESKCPLCQGDNQCLMIRGEADCWCYTAVIPESVLERIPPEARGKTCICPSCAASPLKTEAGR